MEYLDDKLTAAEREFLDKELPSRWKCAVVKEEPGRKVLKVTVEEGDIGGHFTLTTEPELTVKYEEPVRFVVTVVEAKGSCRAEHKVGDRFEFDWCTPEGLCGSAYHTMYPVLHGLLLDGGKYEGRAETTRVTCPDAGWITFEIQRVRWEL